MQREYAYDPSGQLQKITDARRGTLAYKYDPVGRLVEARNGLGVESFEFDPAGNLLGEPQRVAQDLANARADNAIDHLSSHARRNAPTSALMDNLLRKCGDASYFHDERGQVTNITGPNQRAQFFEWDGFGRLRRFESQYDNEMRYYYDALGRRIGKSSCAVVLERGGAGSGWRQAEINRINAERGYGTTTFGWDGDRMAWERSAKSWVQYLYEPGASFVPMLQVRREAQGNQWGPARKAWYQCDHLGTPMELTDETGKIVWEGGYKAFGAAKETSLDGFTNHIRFQGQYFDIESGLHYNRYRHYAPRAGRFVSKDPIGLDGGENLFIYPNNPTKKIDPFGLAETIYLPGEGRSFKDGPRNGNWCGGKWSGGVSGGAIGNAPPVDSMDEICKAHDFCYDVGKPKAECDANMVKDLRALNDDPKKWVKPPPPGTEFSSKGYRRAAISIFDK